MNQIGFCSSSPGYLANGFKSPLRLPHAGPIAYAKGEKNRRRFK